MQTTNEKLHIVINKSNGLINITAHDEVENIKIDLSLYPLNLLSLFEPENSGETDITINCKDNDNINKIEKVDMCVYTDLLSFNFNSFEHNFDFNINFENEEELANFFFSDSFSLKKTVERKLHLSY